MSKAGEDYWNKDFKEKYDNSIMGQNKLYKQTYDDSQAIRSNKHPKAQYIECTSNNNWIRKYSA